MEAAGLVEQRRDGVEHAKKVGYAHKIIKRKNRCKRRSVQRYAPKVPSVLQELFLSCRDVFKGPGTVPSPFDVQKLCRILGKFSNSIHFVVQFPFLFECFVASACMYS